LEHHITDFSVMPQFVEDFYRHIHLEAFVHGNISQDEATQMMALAEKILIATSTRPVPESLRNSGRSHILPPAASFSYTRPTGDAENPNSAIEYYMHKVFKSRCVSDGKTVHWKDFSVIV
jgi:secreted Zn-dependent insulinase-like peptidase